MDGSLCQHCSDRLFNDVKFGFSECFPSHLFCYKCIEKLSIRDFRCPIDKIKSKTFIKEIDEDVQVVERFYFDKILSLKSKSKGAEAQKLVNELHFNSKSVFSATRCSLCFIDFAIELTCGLSKCFNSHKFCFTCVANIASRDFLCPIDHMISDDLVISINGNIYHKDKLYFHSIKYLEEKNDERSNELIEEIKINGDVGHSVCCACFNEYKNESLFGFKDCFYRHSYCFTCFVTLSSKGLVCPADGNSTKILQKSLDGMTKEIDSMYIEEMFFKNEKFMRPFALIEEAKTSGMANSGKYCNVCHHPHKSNIIFGLPECFCIHGFCFNCIENIISNLQCPIDKIRFSKIKVLTYNTILEIDRFNFKFVKRALRKYERNSRALIENIKMCSQISLQTTSCALCHKYQKGSMFGLSNCFTRHGFCRNCIEKVSDGSTEIECPIDRVMSEHAIVILNNVRVDLDKYQFVYERYLAEHKSTKALIYLRKDIHLLRPFPIKVCITCFQDRTDRFMFGFTDCIAHHRMCFDCASARFCSPFQGCVLNHPRIAHLQNPPGTTESLFGIGDDGDKFLVEPLLIHTYFYISKNKTVKPDVRVSSMETIRQSLEPLKNVCIQCMLPIFNASYGFVSCSKYHVFCENCLKDATCRSNSCPIDLGVNVGLSKTLRIDGSTAVLDAHYFRIMDYLLNPSFDKKRTRELKDRLYKERVFDRRTCLKCLSDIVTEESTQEPPSYRCGHGHRLCAKCSSGLQTHETVCVIDGDTLFQSPCPMDQS